MTARKSFLLLIMACFTGWVNSQEDIGKGMEKIAGSYLSGRPGTGMVIGIIKGGKARFYSYGVDKASFSRPDSSSVFELGGLTGLFTSALLAEMESKGEISLNDPVNKYLPKGISIPDYQRIVCEPKKEDVRSEPPQVDRNNGVVGIHIPVYVCYPNPNDHPKAILLCDLSTHSSGLSEHPDNFKRVTNLQDPYCCYSLPDLNKYLQSMKPVDYLDQSYRYSETGLALLGYVLSLSAKMSYDSLVYARITSPLGMGDTRFSLSTPLSKRMPFGHHRKGTVSPFWSFKAFAPALGLHSTATDLLRFAHANLFPSEYGKLGEVLAETQKPRIRMNPKTKNCSAAALGWLILELDKKEESILWREGITGGHSAFIAINKQNGTAVVLLSNIAQSLSSSGFVAMGLLRQ